MTEHSIDIAALRREYNRGGLRHADLTAEPMALFEQWLNKTAAHQPWPDVILLKVAQILRGKLNTDGLSIMLSEF